MSRPTNEAEALDYITEHWDAFDVPDGSMYASKLSRAENLELSGSQLTFEIERHGGTSGARL